MQFEYTFNLSEKDYVELNLGVKKARENKTKWLNRIAKTFLIVAALLIILLSDKYEKDFFVGIGFLAFGLFYGSFVDFLRIRNYKKIYQSSPSMQETMTYSFDEEAIQKISELTKGEIKWSAINEIVTIENYLLLMTSKIGFVPVPKKELNAASEKWIRSKCSDSL